LVTTLVTGGIHAALQQATEAAGGRDIRLGGGAATIRQCLGAALIDELHLAISPVLVGAGEALLAGMNLPALGYECVKSVLNTSQASAPCMSSCGSTDDDATDAIA
jgi:dihydrofolate reductase